MKAGLQGKSEGPANGNGHDPDAGARRAAYDQRRRELVAGYAAIPDAVIADLERRALQQEIASRLGALEQLLLIRRLRAKAQRESMA